ncbi:TetR family transcriptional regulator [Agrobacterium rubi]|uniref:TetR/AcrR family transcriptional regulator n=1 Tax=Agrobacterium rubi TaxID=28099 RepID=UPI0015739F58|nr:TetR family transcriptional regulator C-terminal domain-containing protein [Agrobacterium rubi]NTF10464.1 TetR family transcriptional regulator [Agrobacterium rubi]NTF22858.1 TetR family transcriptional regulator [Agrobacterium rubi]NTF29789.1 TetR family transcriptional regulator [Agrobacterium rubi]
MGQKFQRAEPSERRDLLVRAALRCLARDGRAGLSVRSIAVEAGVSIGLVNHHFGTLESLVALAYHTLASESLASIREAVASAGSCPNKRLDAFLVASFQPPMLEPDVLGVWIVFWSMQRNSVAMASIHAGTYGAYLELLEELLRDVATDTGTTVASPRLASIGLSAMLDGLWLELSLNPETFSPQEGLDLCRNWVKGMLCGAYAS